jgi:uncharacterized SAM-binding protein YcdF (DUF218 family)
VVGDHLCRIIEQGSMLDRTQQSKAQAIVLLGGGGDSLDRMRYAAVLYRRTGLPILVTGGDPKRTGQAEAERIKQNIEADFKVPVRWVESASRNTIENARFSARILKQNGVNTILLVTNGWHMNRAKKLFDQTGINVIPAGAGMHFDNGLTILDFVPSVGGLASSRTFFHETIGMLWSQVVQETGAMTDFLGQ